MDKSTVIALAREAGLWEIFEHYSGEFADGNPEVCLEELERFAALVAQAEPEQEPVAELRQDMKGGGYVHWLSDQVFDEGTTLYTAPTPRKPLTDEELEPLLDEVESYDSTNYDLVKFARAIERAHGIGEGQ